ncbi:hypothetical protein [Microbacterium sp. LBN7]|uniref:hypothetical protein n=1 Tax=Microbacterium sp. LBN7 TaxID=3129773 RepID=UPI00324EF4AB
MDDATALIVNVGVFIATAGAAAVAWWQAIEASRSRNDARDAQKAALTSWQEASSALMRANEISTTTLRSPLAWALNDLATALLSARMVGMDARQQLAVITERMPMIGERAFAAGDVSTQKIVRWCSVYARQVDLGDPPNPNQFMEAASLIHERVNLWMRDPAQADRLVQDDPRADVDFS